jgi:hypothetical protein
LPYRDVCLTIPILGGRSAMTFLAYLAEAVAVHVIDWSIGGLAGWLIGRGGKGRGFGIALVVLYALAVAGMFMGDGTPDNFGPATAIIAFALMLWFGLRRARAAPDPEQP